MDLYIQHLTEHQENFTNPNGKCSFSSSKEEHIVFYTHLIYIIPIIAGNGLIIFIFSSVTLLWTPSNCTIAILAVADLLMGIYFIPMNMAHHIDPCFFQTSLTLCFLDIPMRILLFLFTGSMLMLLTADRYIAVHYPFWHVSHVTIQKIILSAACLVLTDIGVIVIYQYEVVINLPKTSNLFKCDLSRVPGWMRKFLAVWFMSKIIISCACTSIVVIDALRCIKAQRKRTLCFVNKEKLTTLKSDAKVTSALMFLFVILFLPVTIVPLTHDFSKSRHFINGIVAHCIFLNSCFNVVIYSLSKSVYKTAFTFLLTNRPCKWSQLSNVVRSLYASSTAKASNETQPMGRNTNVLRNSAVISETVKTEQITDLIEILYDDTSDTIVHDMADADTVRQNDMGDTQHTLVKTCSLISCCTSTSTISPPDLEDTVQSMGQTLVGSPTNSESELPISRSPSLQF